MMSDLGARRFWSFPAAPAINSMKVRGNPGPPGVERGFVSERAGAATGILSAAAGRVWRRGLIALVAAVYLATLSPGHDFVNDDFAAYVMHAANLAEGRPYTSIHYVANPQALWLAPSNGYPPVYPMLLAPVYKMFGLNLRALKIVAVLCFVLFLAMFERLSRAMLPPVMGVCALLLMACHPIFWDQREYILSEFPYLLFSFAALLVMRETYRDLEPEESRIGPALLLSVLLYCGYGTRSIGIALLVALVVADLIKFKRPSRFMMTAAAGTVLLIVAQTIVITSPAGYISAIKFSPRMILDHVMFYGKTLSYVWQNGYSKRVQIVFALIFTGLAVFGFARKLWKERTAQEFYLLGYVAILIVWSAEIGLRGLLPIVPLYFLYGLEPFSRLLERSSRVAQRGAIAFLLIFCGATYAGEYRRESQLQPEADVTDPTARELFSFLQENTEPSEVIIFSKPRSLALFTNRSVASFAPDELPEASLQFMKNIQARVIVKTNWSPSSWEEFLKAEEGRATEVFRNSEYQVFRIRLAENSSAAAGGG